MSYQEPHWRLPEARFPALELAPFDADKIDRFIDAWYVETGKKWRLSPNEIRQLTNSLHQAVRRPDLWRLAPNPLLLTVMALVHSRRKKLPEKRALLYQEAVDILLEHWEQQKRTEAPQLQDLLDEADKDLNDLKAVLERLAFETQAGGDHIRSPEDGGRIDKLTLLESIAALHHKQDLGWAQRLLEALHLRASLLLERRGGIFSFPHRTFQEYLAGVHLARQPDFAEQAAKVALDTSIYWREVILLAVGWLVHHSRDTGKPRLLVEELCPDSIPETPEDWRKVWLAGEVLLEIEAHRMQETQHGRRLFARVRDRLTELVEQGVLSARERAEAGDVLGQLGDPRFDPERFYLPCRYRGEVERLAGFVGDSRRDRL